MHSYIISDLHLTPERPQTIQAFLYFLSQQAPTAEKIYLLGDLFEYWIGDDAAGMLGAEPVLAAMAQLAAQRPCYFIAGNRDFLVGQQFSDATGFKILPDETVVDLYGTPTLLLHGDSLCTDDIAHVAFRQNFVTNLAVREQFLSLPIPQRIEQAKLARLESGKNKSSISMEIMDVTEQAVRDAFEKFGIQRMIHGHTHRQNLHHYDTAAGQCERHVLGEWGETASIMTVSADGVRIDNPPIPPMA